MKAKSYFRPLQAKSSSWLAILIGLTTFAATLSCDKQTDKARAVARCVIEDPRLSTIIKDIPKAKAWVQDQRETWKQVRARVASGTTPFVPDELAQKLMDGDDILARIDTCLGASNAD